MLERRAPAVVTGHGSQGQPVSGLNSKNGCEFLPPLPRLIRLVGDNEPIALQNLSLIRGNRPHPFSSRVVLESPHSITPDSGVGILSTNLPGRLGGDRALGPSFAQVNRIET